MSDYDNPISVTLTVSATIFGNHSASEAEQTEIKALLIKAIEQINIALDQKDVAIKVTDASEAE